MASLHKKFSNIVNQDFINLINKGVSNNSIPSSSIDILNSLVVGKKDYLADLEDVLKKQDFEKGTTSRTPHGVLSMIVNFGESIKNVSGGHVHNNEILDGLNNLLDYLTDYDTPESGKEINYLGNLPSIDETKKLKQIEFVVDGVKQKFEDIHFKSIFSADDITQKYVSAIVNGNTNLPDNKNSNIGLLYTFFKNLKRRSDSVKFSMQTLKTSNFKGDKSALYKVKKVDSIVSDTLQDRKTVINVSANIRQLVKNSYVTIPEFNIDNRNFLYYKRNTFDLFIDESRTMSFQFVDYGNPDEIDIYTTYKIECQIGSKKYKNCEIKFDSLGFKEKQMSASAFPVVDAYTEFVNIFTKYNEIRNAHLTIN